MNKSQLRQIIREEIKSIENAPYVTDNASLKTMLDNMHKQISRAPSDIKSRLEILNSVLRSLGFTQQEYENQVTALINKNRKAFGTGFMGGNTEA